MRGRKTALRIELTPEERAELERQVRSTTLSAGLVRRDRGARNRPVRGRDDEPAARPRKSPTFASQANQPTRVEHEYGRCGALNMFAAFDTRSGKVYGKSAERKRQEEFIAFLERLDREVPAAKTTIHVVLDYVRMHKARRFMPGRIIIRDSCSSTLWCIAHE